MLPSELNQHLERFRDYGIPGVVRVIEGNSGQLPHGTEVHTLFLVVAEPNFFPHLPYVLAEFGLRRPPRAEEWQCDLLFCPKRFRKKLLEHLAQVQGKHTPAWHPPRPLLVRLSQRWKIIRQLRSREVPVPENASVPI